MNWQNGCRQTAGTNGLIAKQMAAVAHALILLWEIFACEIVAYKIAWLFFLFQSAVLALDQAVLLSCHTSRW
jgi:hypothetical protein